MKSYIVSSGDLWLNDLAPDYNTVRTKVDAINPHDALCKALAKGVFKHTYGREVNILVECLHTRRTRRYSLTLTDITN